MGCPERTVRISESRRDTTSSCAHVGPSGKRLAGCYCDARWGLGANASVVVAISSSELPMKPEKDGITSQPGRPERVAWNARLRTDGGCIFADVSNADTSAVVIRHQ